MPQFHEVLDLKCPKCSDKVTIDHIKGKKCLKCNENLILISFTPDKLLEFLAQFDITT